ncbi:hypothetical protein R75461_05590 [Paraburkholderia nemoris]|nr:hypothetical protein LMG22931_03494 [Paraburkholderia nemoris]CAE6809699.1 hypothetical protein R75461_05590 [Paraburkholderia nemoris]
MGIVSRLASAVTGRSGSSSSDTSGTQSTSSGGNPTKRETPAHLADLPGQAEAEEAAKDQFKGSRFNNGHRRI